MELCINTLTGVSLNILVSPFDTVYDVKYRIQKQEGIPISQQHLIWQAEELEDARSLRDYHIQNGATLQLVLSMRGGPVNTRRVPVADEPTLNEMAEYFLDASREDTSPSGHRLPMLIVYHTGDQLNLYRVIDRDVASSLSYSIGGPSERRAGDSPVPIERREENDKTREKMKQIKSQMQSLNLVKEQKDKTTRKPRSGRLPSSRAVSRLKRFSPTEDLPSSALNKNKPLPPISKPVDHVSSIGVCSSEQPVLTVEPLVNDFKESAFDFGKTDIRLSSGSTATACPATVEVVNGCQALSSETNQVAVGGSVSFVETGVDVAGDLVSADSKCSSHTVKNAVASLSQTNLLGTTLRTSGYISQTLSSASSMLASVSPPSTIKADPNTKTESAVFKDVRDVTSGDSQSLSHNVIPEVTGNTSNTDASAAIAMAVSSVLGLSASPTRLPSSSKGGVKLQSLNAQEVRAMSGMLHTIVRNQTRIGALNDSAGPSTKIGEAASGLPTSMRIKSSRRRFSITPNSARGESTTACRLPSVKVAVRKKSAKKRCAMCGKKTRIAMSFLCRCGNNFCAVHRYAESHACTFDYRSEGRKIIEQNNPVVAAPKLPKI